MNDEKSGLQLATFAGGCFWCMIAPFKTMPGVIEVISGYTGGCTENPTYGEVCSGKTGHYEAVQVLFDPALISYDKLLETFWHQIDPTDPGGQFHDRGQSYQTAVFYHNEEQRRRAEHSKKIIAASGRFTMPIATEILPASTFYPAEEYHQDYYRKSPAHYRLYRAGSRRDKFIETNWGADKVNSHTIEGDLQ